MHKYRHSFSRSLRLTTSIVAIASILLPALLVPPAYAQNAGEDLVNNVVGFGKNTTGGKGGTLCQVTNLNDSGTGSLRACAEAVGPNWITFTVSGTITLQSEIRVKSNKTIDGRGQNIVIVNRGFILGTWVFSFPSTPNITNNVIIENITIKDVTGNAMILIAEGSTNVWIDHVTFQNPIDEAVYIGSNGSDGGYHGTPPQGITLSWLHFITAGLNPEVGGTVTDHAILVSDPALPEDAAITATFHHNWYDRTYMRHPVVRYAKIHALNNYYDKVIIGVDGLTDSQFYSENEVFNFKGGYASNPMVKIWVGGTPDDPRGAANVKVVNPWLINGATVQERNPSTIFNPSSFYSYTAETANTALQTNIVSGAGWQNVTPPPPPPTTLSPPTNMRIVGN